MTPILYIREVVLKVTQAEMARIAGTSQTTISRWESGELDPKLPQLRAIKNAAVAAGAEWNDAWLFECPVSDHEDRGEAAP